MADGFLGRWSRRKIDALQGKPPDEPPPVSALTAPPADATSVAAMKARDARPLTPTDVDPAATGTPETPAPAPPTLEDAQNLTTESDFKPFMTRGVTSEVKNAAMKKLFADPHFNVMDGLDIYIDDYTQSIPIPAASLAKMASAKFLGLVEDDEAPPKPPKGAPTDAPQTAAAEAPMPRDDADTAPSQSVAQSGANADPSASPALPAESSSQPVPPWHSDTAPSPTDHAHTDLRLQPDDATPAPGPRQGAG